MTLQESEKSLSELNSEINKLLEKREKVLKEWNTAFNTENPENITCADESIGDCHNLYLVNNESRMLVCRFSNYDMKGSLEDFYKRIDNSMCIMNIANKRDYETPDFEKNLVYAKAIEVRENVKSMV